MIDTDCASTGNPCVPSNRRLQLTAFGARDRAFFEISLRRAPWRQLKRNTLGGLSGIFTAAIPASHSCMEMVPLPPSASDNLCGKGVSAMPQLHIYPHQQFPSHLNWQAVSFMRVEWPSILLGGHRLGTETYPAERDPIHFVITEQDMLISYAASMQLILAHAGNIYSVAAFGNVFTFPAFRGEGYGRQVVDAAVDFI